MATVPADFISELEGKYFWWESLPGAARSDSRILAQAMDLAGFDDIRRLETTVGADRLAEVMLNAEPGWLGERSWELWRGRLSLATGRKLPEAPPRRQFDAAAI